MTQIIAFKCSLNALQCIACCVLLGPKYALKKKRKIPATPLLLMNPMHHPVTMAKNHDFFTQRPGRKSQNTFFCNTISGLCSLGANKITGDQSTGPRLVHQGFPLPLDENMQCNVTHLTSGSVKVLSWQNLCPSNDGCIDCPLLTCAKVEIVVRTNFDVFIGNNNRKQLFPMFFHKAVGVSKYVQYFFKKK